MILGDKLQAKNKMGFTLIEVIIALMILAVSFPAVYSLFNQSIKTSVALEKKMFAQWTANNYALIQQTLDWKKLSQQTINSKNGPYEFTIKVKILDTPSPNFKKLKVIVYDAPNQEELTRVTTYSAKETRW